MRKRSESEAAALMAAPRQTKPRKTRSDPEAQVGFAVDAAMEAAGFKVCDLSKHRKSGGVWVSAVTSGVLDRYYIRADGVSLFVELKAPGGKLRPSQILFIDLHRYSPIEALVWRSVEECRAWLAMIPTEGR